MGSIQQKIQFNSSDQQKWDPFNKRYNSIVQINKNGTHSAKDTDTLLEVVDLGGDHFSGDDAAVEESRFERRTVDVSGALGVRAWGRFY
jgi:hypothetical protein